MPYAYASAIVSVANGGDWRKAVIQMSMNYLATPSGGGASAVPPSTLQKVLTSSSTSALSAKLLGATNEQIKNAAIGGAVNTYVSDLLYKPESQGGYGLNPKDVTPKLISNATSAATNAILRGQNVGDAVINSALVTAGAHYTQAAYEKVTKNSETLQSAQALVDKAKAKVQSLWNKPLEDKQKAAEAKIEAAQVQRDRAKQSEAYAKKVNKDYADGVPNGPYGQYTADQAENAAKFAQDSNESAQRAIQEARDANNEFLMLANSSGYTAASQEYKTAVNNLQSADYAMGTSQKEFLDSYDKYESQVTLAKIFIQQDVDKETARLIDKEVDDAAKALKDSQDFVNENIRKTEETQAAYEKQQAAIKEQEAQVKAAQAYTQPTTAPTVTPPPAPVAPTGPTPAQLAEIEEKRKQQEYADWKAADDKAKADYEKEKAERQAKEEAAAKALADANTKAKQEAEVKAAQDRQVAEVKAAEEAKVKEAEKIQLATKAVEDKAAFDAHLKTQDQTAKLAQEAEEKLNSYKN